MTDALSANRKMTNTAYRAQSLQQKGEFLNAESCVDIGRNTSRCNGNEFVGETTWRVRSFGAPSTRW